MSKEMLFGGYTEDSSKVNALKFGLNPKVKLIKFEFNPAISFKDDMPGTPGIETEIDVNGLQLKNTVFLVSKAYEKGNEITDPKHPAFIKEVTNMKQRIFHMAKCFATKEEIIEAVMKKVPFGEFVNNVKAVFTEGWEEKELDLFLQYQWTQKEGSDRKFLEVPKKTKQGYFLIPHVEGDWKEVRIVDGVAKDAEGKEIGKLERKVLTIGEDRVMLSSSKTALCYICKKEVEVTEAETTTMVEKLVLHPFLREEWFMENGWGQADDGAEENLDNNW